MFVLALCLSFLASGVLAWLPGSYVPSSDIRSLAVFQSYFALPNQHDIPSTDHRHLAMFEYHIFAEQYNVEDARRQSRLTVHHRAMDGIR